MYDLSIIIPSIRPANWHSLLQDIDISCSYDTEQITYEVIFIGPYNAPSRLENYRFIESFRCPSACLQEGVSVCNGEYITWLPDDCRVEPHSLYLAVKNIKQLPPIDGIVMRYSEGENFSGIQDRWSAYWFALTHDGLRFKHVENWMIAPCFMYNTNFFKEVGGLDCSMEHINLNTHDLAFRIQKLGGKLHFSPTKIFSADWDARLYEGDHKTIQLAYDENDLPKFKSIWDADILDRPLKIDFDNWKNTETKWTRRFK